MEHGIRRGILVAGIAVLAVLAVLAVSCKIKGERQPYATIGADAEALRAAFNADAGKVRVVVLVAPT